MKIESIRVNFLFRNTAVINYMLYTFSERGNKTRHVIGQGYIKNISKRGVSC